MSHERRVMLFIKGHSQAVRVSRDAELPWQGCLHAQGDRLIIEPAGPKSLLAALATLAALDEHFPPIRDLEIDDVEL